MNSKVESGASSEIDGAGNKKLTSPSTCTLTMYGGEPILAVWPEISELVSKAAFWGRGEYLAEDVLVMCYSEKMQAWVFRDEGKVVLICITELVQYPRKTVCNIYAVAGYRMAELWKEFFPRARAWFALNGVEEIQTTCRAEIAAKIAEFGFGDYVQTLKLDLKELK